MKEILASQLFHINHLKIQNVIDVRTKSEYDHQNIPGSTHIPLSELSQRLREIPKEEEIYIVCQSGNRSKQACQVLQSAGHKNFINLAGGINGLKKNNSCALQGNGVLPVMRQVMIAAGSLVLLGLLLAYFVHPYFIFISLFVGVGLLFAGLTGYCGMAMLLEKMPWNKSMSNYSEK